MAIQVLPLFDRISAEELLTLRPSGLVVACDFYVDGIERAQEVVGGYQTGRLLNIDHHAPTRRMMRRVSSTNLALEHLTAAPRDEDALITINHTDCDSVLACGIMAGLLPADPRFGEAAIAADHTGKEDAIADLLQALDSRRDLNASLRNLQALLKQRPLEHAAAEALYARRRKRERAAEVVSQGRIQVSGPLAFGVLDHAIDGEFFPALLPEAVVILLANPMPGRPGYWQVKLRLGDAAPEGLSLHDLRLKEIDPAYGGRWNAGSNRRGGGTDLSPERYAEAVAARLPRALAGS